MQSIIQDQYQIIKKKYIQKYNMRKYYLPKHQKKNNSKGNKIVKQICMNYYDEIKPWIEMDQDEGF